MPRPDYYADDVSYLDPDADNLSWIVYCLISVGFNQIPAASPLSTPEQGRSCVSGQVDTEAAQLQAAE